MPHNQGSIIKSKNTIHFEAVASCGKFFTSNSKEQENVTMRLHCKVCPMCLKNYKNKNFNNLHIDKFKNFK